MHDTIMGMTTAIEGLPIDSVQPGVCRGMLSGGPQVDAGTMHGPGAAARGSGHDPSMADAGRRVHVGGGEGGGVSMADAGRWGNCNNEEGPANPEPD